MRDGTVVNGIRIPDFLCPPCSGRRRDQGHERRGDVGHFRAETLGSLLSSLCPAVVTACGNTEPLLTSVPESLPGTKCILLFKPLTFLCSLSLQHNPVFPSARHPVTTHSPSLGCSEVSELFSGEAVLVSIPTGGVLETPFLHFLTSIWYHHYFIFSHSDRCGVISCCSRLFFIYF